MIDWSNHWVRSVLQWQSRSAGQSQRGGYYVKGTTLKDHEREKRLLYMRPSPDDIKSCRERQYYAVIVLLEILEMGLSKRRRLRYCLSRGWRWEEFVVEWQTHTNDAGTHLLGRGSWGFPGQARYSSTGHRVKDSHPRCSSSKRGPQGKECLREPRRACRVRKALSRGLRQPSPGTCHFASTVRTGTYCMYCTLTILVLYLLDV